MFIARHSLWKSLLTGGCIVICGCGGSKSFEMAMANAHKIQTESLLNFDTANSSDTAESKTVAIQLPYPNRENPFIYVGEETTVVPQVISNSFSDIRVLGFADVGQPRVMLMLKDQTRSMAVGDKNNGVEVLEIAPPHVRLKLANLTWNASMFDEKSLK